MTIQTPTIIPGTNPSSTASPKLVKAAQELEATFLAEMLKSAGFGKERSELGGGLGEQQFSSFLVDSQAEALVKAGGLGLTDVFVEALKERAND